MQKNIRVLLLFLFTIVSVSAFSWTINKQKEKATQENAKGKNVTFKESKDKTKKGAEAKVDSVKSKTVSEVESKPDTLKAVENLKFKFYKKDAHASYYAPRFEGRRTASGKRFSNKGYTAAHKKLPFGTKVKVTNEANGKSVVVEITDRGPFSKVREIDLSKKAFMEIASNKNSGSTVVKIEIEDK